MDWKSFSNMDVAAFAAYLLGGENRYVSTEEIAVAASRLDPGRFTWQNYPEQIDLNKVQRCLSAADRGGCGNLLAGSAKTGWMLTGKGVEFSREHAGALPDAATLFSPMSEEGRRFRPWQRRRIQAHPAFKKVVSGLSDLVTTQEAERFFILGGETGKAAKKQKVDSLMRSFGHDPVIGPVIGILAGKVG